MVAKKHLETGDRGTVSEKTPSTLTLSLLADVLVCWWVEGDLATGTAASCPRSMCSGGGFQAPHITLCCAVVCYFYHGGFVGDGILRSTISLISLCFADFVCFLPVLRSVLLLPRILRSTDLAASFSTSSGYPDSKHRNIRPARRFPGICFFQTEPAVITSTPL